MPEMYNFKYITSKRLWARGWHECEAETIGWLKVILIVSALLGAGGGVALGLVLSLPIEYVLLSVLVAAVVGVLIGIAIARAVIPFVWDVKLQRYQEEQ